MVRMNKELAEGLETLRAEFEGLPPSTIVSMLVSACLALPIDQQIKVVNSQVRKPGSEPTVFKSRIEHPGRNKSSSRSH